jgi:hypothetical protein
MGLLNILLRDSKEINVVPVHLNDERVTMVNKKKRRVYIHVFLVNKLTTPKESTPVSVPYFTDV